MLSYIVYGDCSERKGVKEEEKCAPLSERLSLKPVEERWGQPKGKINQDVSKSRMRQGCIARGISREGGREERRRIYCSYTVVLFHAPFRAENYSGARDSLWKCILNGSERTANDTRDCTFHPVPPSIIYISRLLDLVSPFLIILLLWAPRVFSTLLSFVSYNFLSLSLSLISTIHIYTNVHVYRLLKKNPFQNRPTTKLASRLSLL